MNKLPIPSHSDALILLSKLELMLVSKAEIQSVTMGSRGKMDSLLTMEFAGAVRWAIDNARNNTGCKDMHGRAICLGDRVRYNNASPHTKEEYWNPEYEVIFLAPEYALKHIGGGKDGGSHQFILRNGGGNGQLEIMENENV